MNTDIRELLEGVSRGTVSVEDARLKSKKKPIARWVKKHIIPSFSL